MKLIKSRRLSGYSYQGYKNVCVSFMKAICVTAKQGRCRCTNAVHCDNSIINGGECKQTVRYQMSILGNLGVRKTQYYMRRYHNRVKTLYVGWNCRADGSPFFGGLSRFLFFGMVVSIKNVEMYAIIWENIICVFGLA